MHFFAVGDETHSRRATLSTYGFPRQVLQDALNVLTEKVDKPRFDVVIRHVQNKDVGWWFGEDVVATIVFGANELVRAEAQLRSLVLVHTHASVVQMLEIFGWHFSCRLTEWTLESATTVDKLHKRAHVSFAAATTNGAKLAHIHHWGSLFPFFQLGEGADNQAERYGCLLHHVRQSWNTLSTKETFSLVFLLLKP